MERCPPGPWLQGTKQHRPECFPRPRQLSSFIGLCLSLASTAPSLSLLLVKNLGDPGQVRKLTQLSATGLPYCVNNKAHVFPLWSPTCSFWTSKEQQCAFGIGACTVQLSPHKSRKMGLNRIPHRNWGRMPLVFQSQIRCLPCRASPQLHKHWYGELSSYRVEREQ